MTSGLAPVSPHVEGEVGNVPDLDNELRALTDSRGPLDLEKATDLVARLTYLGEDGNHRDAALIRDILSSHNEAWRPEPRFYPHGWFLTAAGWRERAWQKRLVVRCDRDVIVRDLFMEAQEALECHDSGTRVRS